MTMHVCYAMPQLCTLMFVTAGAYDAQCNLYASVLHRMRLIDMVH